jgi:hypothetical protein
MVSDLKSKNKNKTKQNMRENSTETWLQEWAETIKSFINECLLFQSLERRNRVFGFSGWACGILFLFALWLLMVNSVEI